MFPPLTRRESEVLKCLAEGHSTKQTANILGIAFKTGVHHRYRLMEKLDIHKTADLVRYAIRQGLVEASAPGGRERTASLKERPVADDEAPVKGKELPRAPEGGCKVLHPQWVVMGTAQTPAAVRYPL